MELFTIGHSNHSMKEFISLLTRHGITALADVRSHPYSRYLPHFNLDSLKRDLPDVGIAYVFLGQELGARPENLNCYINGKAVYESIAATERFSVGIERVCQGSQNHRIALMCAEQDPITCHRAVLVCPHLKNRGLDIHHILKNGDLETHIELEKRLLKLHHLQPNEQKSSDNTVQLNLFETPSLPEDSAQPIPVIDYEELLEKAYQMQGEQIAYVDKNWHKKIDKYEQLN